MRNTREGQGRLYEFLRCTRIVWLAALISVLVASEGAWAQETKAASSASADTLLAKEILSKEFALEKAEIEVNGAMLEKLTLPDFIEVNETIMNRDQVLAMLRRVSDLGCRIQPIRMKDARVTFLSPDIATVIYHATQTGTCGSHSLTATGSASTVWVRRGGQWLAEMHVEHAKMS